MRHLSLAQKIIAGVAAVILGLVATTYLVLSSWIDADTQARLRQDLLVTRSVLDELSKSRLGRLEVLCASIAQAPRFKAAISEQDPTTVLDQARVEARTVGGDLVVVLGGKGQLLAWIGPGRPRGDAFVAPMLDRARGGTSGSGLWLLGRRLYEVAAEPIRFGDEIVGALALGSEVGQRQVQEIHGMTHTEVLSLLPDGVAGPSTLEPAAGVRAAERIAPVLRATGRGAAGQTVFQVDLDGQRHLVLAEPQHGLVDGHENGDVGDVLLMRNLDVALAHLRRVQGALLLGGAIAFGVAMVLALLIVRTVTTPVAQLVRGAQEVGRGNYDFAIAATSADEIGVLAQRFEEMRKSIKDYIGRVQEAERVKRDLDLARSIQASLLPRSAPSIAGAQVAGQCVPAHEVGGDYFDYLSLPGGRVALVVADVSGHSVGAALMMAMSRAVLRSLTLTLAPPGTVLTRASALLYDDLVRASLFFSAFHAVYDPEGRRLVYSSAGHNPPLVVRTQEPTEQLSTEGMLAGLMPDAVCEDGRLMLAAGDILVLYTDGIVEAAIPDGSLYGLARLDARVRALSGESADAIVQGILTDVSAFTGGAPPADDRSLIVLRVTG